MWFLFLILIIWFFIYIGGTQINNKREEHYNNLKNIEELSKNFNSFLKNKNNLKLNKLVRSINLCRYYDVDIEYYYQNMSGKYCINKLSGWFDIFINTGGNLISNADQNFINNIFNIIKLDLSKKIKDCDILKEDNFKQNYKLLKIGFISFFNEFSFKKNTKLNIFGISFIVFQIIAGICTILGIHL